MIFCKIDIEEDSECKKCCKYCNNKCSKQCIFDKRNVECKNETERSK